MFVEIFDTHRSPVGCNFISGRSESVHEESADDEGRTVPSSGAALFLRFALNLWRYPARPPCEDNICLRPTDCDFNAWRHCQKGNKLDRELASSSPLPSPSNLFVEVCLPRCTRNAPYDFCRRLAPRYYVFLWISIPLTGEAKVLLTSLNFSWNTISSADQGITISNASWMFLDQVTNAIRWLYHVNLNNINRIRRQSCTLQNGGALPSLLSPEHIWNVVESLSRSFAIRAATCSSSIFTKDHSSLVARYGRTTPWRPSRRVSSNRPRVMRCTQGCCYCHHLAPACATVSSQ